MEAVAASLTSAASAPPADAAAPAPGADAAPPTGTAESGAPPAVDGAATDAADKDAKANEAGAPQKGVPLTVPMNTHRLLVKQKRAAEAENAQLRERLAQLESAAKAPSSAPAPAAVTAPAVDEFAWLDPLLEDKESPHARLATEFKTVSQKLHEIEDRLSGVTSWRETQERVNREETYDTVMETLQERCPGMGDDEIEDLLAHGYKPSEVVARWRRRQEREAALKPVAPAPKPVSPPPPAIGAAATAPSAYHDPNDWDRWFDSMNGKPHH